ncbi:hypothetical protein MVEN_02151700 [Mycena venus]|uniref:Protein kinase domain-containing protein n=1 Tax=Mycena venus TaxID=2733690 RepID=A0A8H7CIF7_9AGAR|nr:hypothetical protein MVEN_02151700 [Mycena venus]
MDAETHIEPEESTAQSDLDILRRTCNAASINHSARDINFKDCVTNVTFTAAPTAPSDFRRIPLGDIDLLHEIHVDYDSGVVNRHARMQVRRRVHSARVEGRSVTAVVYQGNGADEEWRRDLEKHLLLWHPNIIQIYGTASSRSKHATLYHDDLIPFQYFLDLYRHLPILTVQLYACGISRQRTIIYILHFKRMCGHTSARCGSVTRRVGLCAELTIPIDQIDVREELDGIPGLQGVQSLRTSNTEAMVIDTVTLKGYHNICSLILSHLHNVYVSLSIIVNLGAVILWPRDDVLEHWVEITSLADTEVFFGSWFNPGKGNGEQLENGWTRFRSEDIIGENIYLWIVIRGEDSEVWLSQANHIFSRLEITSDFEDYALVYGVRFMITISTSKVDCPSGFLFLCPENHFQIRPSSFAWPDSPAYWSLDSLGVNRLSTEEATRLGFPTIQPDTQIQGYHWGDSVYAGLRQFHQAKGFDPDSQDIAKHLEYPLFQLSDEIEVPFADVTKEDSDEQDDWNEEDVNTTNESEEGQSTDIKENGILLEESVLHSYSEGHVPFAWPNEPAQEQDHHRGDPLAELLFLGQENEFQIEQSLGWTDAPAYWSNSAGVLCPGQQVIHYGVSNSGPDSVIDGSWNTGVYGGVGQFHQANIFNIGPHLGQPLDQLSHDPNFPFAHVEEVTAGEVQSLVNTDRQFDNPWPSASADRVPDTDRETIPVKRSFEETAISLPENTSGQGFQGPIQDNLALQRLMLEEKAQLIEMQRLGVFTKEEFISHLAQIEARYEEPVTRPIPAKRPWLSY